jgi:hypothetical protein
MKLVRWQQSISASSIKMKIQAKRHPESTATSHNLHTVTHIERVLRLALETVNTERQSYGVANF